MTRHERSGRAAPAPESDSVHRRPNGDRPAAAAAAETTAEAAAESAASTAAEPTAAAAARRTAAATAGPTAAKSTTATRRDVLGTAVTAAAGVTTWAGFGTEIARGSARQAGGTTYYVDADAGSDANDGTSPEDAWASLDPVNARTFGPGDRILLRAGTAYHGRLDPSGSGAEGAPIVVDAYGDDGAASGAATGELADGEKPAIHAAGEPEAIHLHNQEHWELWNLEVTNEGTSRGADRCGVRVTAEDLGGRLSHIHLRELYVHDVNGALEKDAGGSGYGILFRNTQGAQSAFEDVLVEGCHLQRTDRNGICWHSSWGGPNAWFPSTDVRVRDNLLEDVGGDGIKPWGCEAPLVEHNTCRDCRARAPDYAVAIWPWGCVDALFQFNEASHTHGTLDGQGFDADYNCRGTVFQYNYSHDNDGGFILICDDGDAGDWNRGNVDVTVRYNVSENDHARTFQCSGPIEDVRIYGNVVYVPEDDDVDLVLDGDWGGYPGDVAFWNNVFHVDGTATYSLAGATDHEFVANCYAGDGTHEDRPADPQLRVGDAGLVDPGSGGDGRDSVDGYRLRPGSPCLDAGRPVDDGDSAAAPPERGYWGDPVADDGSPNVGAYAGDGVDDAPAFDGAEHAFPDHEPGRAYRIVLEDADLALSLDGDDPSSAEAGASAALAPVDDDRADQRWHVAHVGGGEHRIENAATGHVLDVADESTDADADVLQWTWRGGRNQLFEVVPEGEAYVLRAVHSGLAIGPQGANAESGASVVQRADYAARVRWSVEPVDGSSGPCPDAASGGLQVDGQTVCNVDGDEYYRDVNGDGRVGNRDVGAFFQQFHLDAWDREAFDYSGNGRVSHGDVVALFDHVV